MIHPLFRLFATHPELVGEHALAYAALLGDDVAKTSAALKRRAVFVVATVLLGFVGLLLGGVAMMLWAVTPPAAIHSAWALAATPAVPLVLALLCWAAGRPQAEAPFDNLKQQFAADLQMLREVGAS